LSGNLNSFAVDGDEMATTLNLRDMDELRRKRLEARVRAANAAGPTPSGVDFMGTFAPTTRTWGEAGSRMLPLSGEAWTMDDARRAFNEGNYGEAALNAALGLVPLGGTMAAVKNVGKKSLASVVKETGGLKPPGLPESIDRIVATPIQGRGNALKTTEEGKRVYDSTGAIGSITPQRLGTMRKDYLSHMEAGAPGRDWYDQSSAAINRWTGGGMEDADKMANALAVTSSRTPVGPNLMYANKGWNQYLTGDPVRTGGFPNVMGPQIDEAFTNPAASASGLKRSPFSAGLSVDWRGPEFANRATHDIHDMRAWGITDPNTGELWSKGVPNAAHRFLDEQADYVTSKANRENLAGFSDWTPYKSQAAAWISQKAKKEGKAIGDTAHDYSYFAPEYQGQIAREWQPSTRVPHLEELRNAPLETRQDFANALEQVNTGPQGIDRLARGMGALADTTIPNVGSYEGVTNPGFLSQINVGKKANPLTYADQALDPASEQVLRSVSAAHGLLGVQDQVGYNYLTSKAMPGGPANQSNAFRIDYGAPFSGQSLTNEVENLSRLGVDLPLADPKGVRGLGFGAEGQTTDIFPPDVRKALMQHAKESGGELRWMNNSGNIFPPEPSPSWSAKPYVSEIEAGGPRMVENFNKTMTGGYADEMLSAVQSQAQKHGLTSAHFYEPMMTALSTGGLPALKDLIAKGIVPVAVLGMLGLSQFEDPMRGAD
jgi:hypothetical protein